MKNIDNENFQELGKMIKILRDNKGLTQEQLAEALDISCPYVSGLECGKKIPSLSIFLGLVEILETEPNTLLRGSYTIHDVIHLRKELMHEIDELSKDQVESLLNMLRVMKK